MSCEWSNTTADGACAIESHDHYYAASYVVDNFTLRHLSEWVSECVFAQDAERFTTWVLAQLAGDPTVSELGWPSLYRTWMHETFA